MAARRRNRKPNLDERSTEGEIEVGPSFDPEKASTDLALPSEVLPNILPILPLRERPFFPVQTMPVMLPASPWLDTIKEIG